MRSRLRRWIALLALLFVPVTGSAASPLCTEMGTGAPGAEPAAVHHGHGGEHAHHAQAPSGDDGDHRRPDEDGRRDPSSPACPLGMMAGVGGCLGGFLSAAAPRTITAAADRPSFLPPVQPRPRLSAASLFRPPRA